MIKQEQTTDIEWVDIVDEKNEVIAQSSLQEIRSQRLRHRAIYVVVHDGMGNILVQRRTQTKVMYPGWLSATVVGVVKKDELILESARREAEKELGIADVPFAEHGLFYFENEHYRVWGSLLSCVSRGPFALQEELTTEVRWMNPEDITRHCDAVTPDSLKALSLWLTRHYKQNYGKPLLNENKLKLDITGCGLKE